MLFVSYCGKTVWCTFSFSFNGGFMRWYNKVAEFQKAHNLLICKNTSCLVSFWKLKVCFQFSLLGFHCENKISLFCGRWRANYQSDEKHATDFPGINFMWGVTLLSIEQKQSTYVYKHIVWRSWWHALYIKIIKPIMKWEEKKKNLMCSFNVIIFNHVTLIAFI